MYLNDITILDYRNKEANKFSFSKGANIICADRNTAGKTCLIKSIYYALGLDITKFPNGWKFKNMIFKLSYTHNNQTGTIYRTPQQFWVNSIPMTEKDYSEWFCQLLNINIKLPIKDKDIISPVYASVPILLYYIDQDTSWSGALYKRTINLQFYKNDSIPKNIFEYFLNISNDIIIQLEEEKTDLNSERNKLSSHLESLNGISDKFEQSDISIVNFNPENNDKEIKKYLSISDTLKDKIKAYNSRLYEKKIIMDTYKLELEELKAIIKYLNKTYKNISHKCTECNSQLTPEQSMTRMRLDDNLMTLSIEKEELEKKIENIQQKNLEYEKDKSVLEEQYNQLLSIAETKQNNTTLAEYIKNEAKQITSEIYRDIKLDIADQVDDLTIKISNKNKEIRNLIKNTKDRRESLENIFKTYLDKFQLIFNKANLDYKFLEFKEINDSGAAKNEVWLSLYIAYTKILLNNSKIEIPFGIDSIVKDEVDEDILSKFYCIVEDNILTAKQQTFFAMLNDKKPFIKNYQNYNEIILPSNERILKSDLYEIYEKEFLEIMNPNV